MYINIQKDENKFLLTFLLSSARLSDILNHTVAHSQPDPNLTFPFIYDESDLSDGKRTRIGSGRREPEHAHTGSFGARIPSPPTQRFTAQDVMTSQDHPARQQHHREGRLIQSLPTAQLIPPTATKDTEYELPPAQEAEHTVAQPEYQTPSLHGARPLLYEIVASGPATSTPDSVEYQVPSPDLSTPADYRPPRVLNTPNLYDLVSEKVNTAAVEYEIPAAIEETTQEALQFRPSISASQYPATSQELVSENEVSVTTYRPRAPANRRRPFFVPERRLRRPTTTATPRFTLPFTTTKSPPTYQGSGSANVVRRKVLIRKQRIGPTPGIYGGMPESKRTSYVPTVSSERREEVDRTRIEDGDELLVDPGYLEFSPWIYTGSLS